MAFNAVMENEMRLSTTAAEAKAKASYRSRVASSRLTTAQANRMAYKDMKTVYYVTATLSYYGL